MFLVLTVCNFVVQEKCQKTVTTPCQSAAFSFIEVRTKTFN